MTIVKVEDMVAKPAPDHDRDRMFPDVDLGLWVGAALNTLRRNIFLILLLQAVAIPASLYFVLTATPTYTARASLLIDPRKGGTPVAGSAEPALLVSNDALTVDSEVRVLGSREVTGQTAEALGLFDRSPVAPEPGLASRIRHWLETQLNVPVKSDPMAELSPSAMADRNREAIRIEFARPFTIERSGESFVIDITYTSTDLEFAPKAINTLIEQYLSVSREEDASGNARVSDWLSDRMTKLSQDLQEAEQAVVQFRNTNALVAVRGNLLTTDYELRTATENLIDQRARLDANELRLQKLNEQIDQTPFALITLPNALRTNVLQDLEVNYAELVQEEQLQLLSRGNATPFARQAAQNKKLVEQLIVQEYGRIRDSLIAENDILRQEIAAADASIAELREETRINQANEVKLRSLEREAASKREILERFMDAFNKAAELSSFQEAGARVIAWAVPPNKKTWPQTKQIVILSSFAALVIAVGAAFAMDAVDTSFRTARDAQTVLGLPLVGIVPSFRRDKVRQKRYYQPGRSVGTSGHARMGNGKGRMRRFFFALSWPESLTAETLRTLVFQTCEPGIVTDHNRPSGLVLGFASTNKYEGKTTLAANFAMMLARNSDRVVLVDLDLFQAGLTKSTHRSVPLANSIGTWFADGPAAMDLFAPVKSLCGVTVVRADSQQRFDPHNPKDIERLELFLSELQSRYEYVIVDLPPLHNTVFGRTAAALCDKLVLVVRWGKTKKSDSANLMTKVDRLRDKFVGVIYNRAEPKRYALYNFERVSDYYY